MRVNKLTGVMHGILKCALVAIFAAQSSVVYSLEQEPIVIEADSATINEKEGISHYSGHVLVKQGSLIVNANEVQVKTANGNIDSLEAFGDPVTFSRQSENAERNVAGESKHLVYRSEKGLVVLNDEARLAQNGHTFSGNRIVYNIRDDVITATKADSGDQRVKITIQPKSEPDNQ